MAPAEGRPHPRRARRAPAPPRPPPPAAADRPAPSMRGSLPDGPYCRGGGAGRRLRQAVEPEEAEAAGKHGDEQARGREGEGDLRLLVLELALARQVVVDLAQALLVLGAEVAPARRLGDATQRRLVEARVDATALDLQHRALRRADADRVDLHAGLRRRFRDLERVGTDVALPVGEEDDARRRGAPPRA